MRERRRNSPDVAITNNKNEPEAIAEALKLIDGQSMINNDDVVVITPNFVQKQQPETGIVVGDESLRAIIKFVKGQNPKRIVVATGSGQKDTTDVLKLCGFDLVIEDEGVEFIDLNYGPFTQVQLNHENPNTTNLNDLFEQMTFLISFTQLKIHEEATISAAIKNITMGWPPAQEHGFPKKNCHIHDNLHGFIKAMAEIIPIDLSIISANPAMIATGPAGGIPKHTGIVIASTDGVAADTVGARLLGFKPQAVNYLFELSKCNIGESDINKMNIKGLTIQDAQKTFSYEAYGVDNAVVDKK